LGARLQVKPVFNNGTRRVKSTEGSLWRKE
jgi:hypothetical protein